MYKKKYSIFNPIAIGFQYSIILIVSSLLAISAKAQYQLHIIHADKDTSFNYESLKLQTNFGSEISCAQYINNLPAQLNSKGYLSASIDSLR